MADELVWHYSEDPFITVFHPHVPPTSPLHEPRVWAVREDHGSDFWFPRDCPRVLFWRGDRPAGPEAEALLGGAHTVHAIEWGWLERVRLARVFRYGLAAAPFRPGENPIWYLTAQQAVHPVCVEPVGDLLAAHATAGIELRVLSRLHALGEQVVASGLPFSLIRMRNAAPPAGP